MAASLSSALVPSFPSSLGMKYDVFLNFRGKDTRNDFTARLYENLKDAGVHTFMDDEVMKEGEVIGETLMKAIEESRYCVVVISSGYAHSKWCLMELAAMFEHKKEIIPVFYQVDPSDVRHQKGSFKDDFEGHEKHNSAHVEEWRQAMAKVGQLKGLVIDHKSNYKSEAQVIEKIVERVGGCGGNPLHVAEHLVGIESNVEEVMKLLNIKEGGVRMVGIYGMGGVGKTTLVREIYNKLLLHRFTGFVYMEGIKDQMKNYGMPKLQQELISKTLKLKNINIYSTSEGITEIKRRFCHMRMLVILDDVDHRDQLKALAGGCDWFGEGSRILITTRDMHLLDEHRVDCKYEVQELNSRDSLRLFSLYAFNSEAPSEEYEEIAMQVSEAAGGHPLALQVLGKSLIGKKNKRMWQEAVTKLIGSSFLDINKCLEVSFVGLDQEQKDIFLDVACFFVYKNKGEVVDILKGCDFKAPELTIDALLQKCLLKADEYGRLKMHDLLRYMGRNIASCSRLWDQQKVWDVLDGHTGTAEIKGIVCQKIPERRQETVDVEAFSNMSNLRLLLLESIHLEGDFSKMPTSLRSLKWNHCPLKMLPDSFNIQKIGFLNLSKSNITQVCSDSHISKKKVFPNLKLLDLSECKELVKLPDLSCSLKLEKLNLRGCTKVELIPDSISLLKNLVYLDISGCERIKELPDAIGELDKLIELYLHDTKIQSLPYSIRSLHTLERLSLNGWEKLKMLPSVAIANSGELEVQNFEESSQLRGLPDLLGNFKSLTVLGLCQNMSKTISESVGKLTKLEKLRATGAIRVLPNAVFHLNQLHELDLSYSFIEELPDSICYLQNVRILNLSFCTGLRCLPESISSLTKLETLDLSNCYILTVLPSSIGHLKKLKRLSLVSVPIQELPSSIKFLENLIFLNICHCRKLETVLPLWELKSLQSLSVGSTDQARKDPVDNIVELSGTSPHTQEYRKICFIDAMKPVYIWILSVTVGNVEKEIFLFEEKLHSHNRRQWLSYIIPNDFVNIQSKKEGRSPNQGETSRVTPDLNWIRVINLSDSNMEELEEYIVHLPNLKILFLSNCKRLKCLPSSFGCLTSLRHLCLWGCKKLTTLPDSIGGLTNLHNLVLGRSGIKEFPSTMKSLQMLYNLDVDGCVELRGGVPLCDLKGLRTLVVGGLVDMVERVTNGIVEIRGNSRQLQQFSIRFKGCNEQLYPNTVVHVWLLSIRTLGDHQDRVIQVHEIVESPFTKNWGWLGFIFPEKFQLEQSTLKASRTKCKNMGCPSYNKNSFPRH